MHIPGKTLNRCYAIYLSSLLLICTLLLSACTNGGPLATSTPTVKPTATPGISNALLGEGPVQLQSFQKWIALIQQYGGDTSSYQQQYTSDQQALNAATTSATYSAALDTLKAHVVAIQIPALKVEIANLRQKLIDGAAAWGQAHTFHDTYDGNTYQMAYEYGSAGLADYPYTDLLNKSQTADDYQYLADQENIWLSNFQAYQKNASDQTPYNQIHATDTQLMQQYGYMAGKVIVVSLSEQAVRVYQDGHLVNSFQVVTGMPGHPSLPGTWWIETHQRNLTFNSGVKPGQDGYYPPTPIGWAMQYHSGGFFLHESWWRSQYGPDDQFPHRDPRGGSFATEGSHGCVNISTANVTWLYNFAEVSSTKIIIY
jgi:lipoprotein-anchoring transpeptidase ErfK/SrfK